MKKDEQLKLTKTNKGRRKYYTKKECNCNRTHPCPLQNECNTYNVVYKGKILSKNSEVNEYFYIGGATKFKERWANRIMSFKNKDSK